MKSEEGRRKKGQYAGKGVQKCVGRGGGGGEGAGHYLYKTLAFLAKKGPKKVTKLK